ncbi:MAG: enoyl-CoA hydratase/isomerase family protein [Brevundimonas sp.]|uniref:enoyl-CoA hydratase/isomerase family protein n=1 Tax=Brevundimonas sp. TaxID=1871086 RepID=UPI002736F45A|nr:enoyl-CoA hydratase/isomerase family protein [Brevundimonas sp.]MDP3403478.1 enoyl-CoA hydratase/isomerase family protein [Brevundimonas sp.]
MIATSDPRVRLDIAEGLATLTLTRGRAGNALDDQSGRELRAAALACATAEDVRAVLLCAQGPNFCFGGDLSHIAAQTDRGAAVRDMTFDFHAAVDLLAGMRKPLVCAVRGAATGAGLSLAAISDYVICSDTAFFAYAYCGVGLSADGGLTWSLPRVIGLRAFQSLYLTGRRVGAEEGQRLGLVSEIVEDGALDARTVTFARQLADGPTLAYGAIKRLAASAFSQGLAAHLDAEGEALVALARSDDTDGAIKALLARAQPTFKGR